MNEDLLPLPHAPSSKRTILLVEDDLLLRSNTARYLRHAGYHVIEALNASEATSLISSLPDIELVFSDVNMPPGDNGYLLASWLSSTRPWVPALIASSDRQDTDSLNASATRRFVRKPYQLPEILELVRSMLSPHT